MSEPSTREQAFAAWVAGQQCEIAQLRRELYATHTRAILAEITASIEAERRMHDAYARSEN